MTFPSKRGPISKITPHEGHFGSLFSVLLFMTLISALTCVEFTAKSDRDYFNGFTKLSYLVSTIVSIVLLTIVSVEIFVYFTINNLMEQYILILVRFYLFFSWHGWWFHFDFV